MYEIKLGQCDDVLDRGVVTHKVKWPRRLWIAVALMVLATAVVLGTCIGVIAMLDLPLPGQRPFLDLIPPAIAILFVEAISLPPLFTLFLFEQRTQRYITLVSASGGVRLITLHSAVDAPEDSFEDFADELVKGIRRSRVGPPASSFERMAAGPKGSSEPSMEVPLSVYESMDAGWSWVYTLFPYRLVLEGKKRKEHHCCSIELEWCAAAPDRGMRRDHTLPRRFYAYVFLSYYLIVAGVVVIAIATGFLFEPGHDPVKSIVGCGLLYGVVPILGVLTLVFRKRSQRPLATFKRASNGRALFYVVGKCHDSTGDFESFVLDVIAAIEVARGQDLNTTDKIKRAQ